MTTSQAIATDMINMITVIGGGSLKKANNTPVLSQEFITAHNQKQLSEMRVKFIEALKVDKKEVWYVFQLNFNECINNRDFEGTAEDWHNAETHAIEEAIYFAEKLDEKETMYHESKNNRGCVLSFQ